MSDDNCLVCQGLGSVALLRWGKPHHPGTQLWLFQDWTSPPSV